MKTDKRHMQQLASGRGYAAHMMLQDDYGNLVHKVRAFFLAAGQMFPQAQWFIKTDDDIFISPGRVAYATEQWTKRSAGANEACSL